jgi:uncharacterized protein (DUF433 family)
LIAFSLAAHGRSIPPIVVVYHGCDGKARVSFIATLSRSYEYDDVLRNKPVRQPGQDLRTLPTFTIPEAAEALAIKQRTLFSWYEGDNPILKPSGTYGASGTEGTIHLLSYRDLEEAYRVFLLRERFHFSFQTIRRSMRNARKMFRSQHPLQRADAVKECLRDLVYDKPARGMRPRTVTSLSNKPGQEIIEEVANMFAERIETGKFIFPWRFAADDHHSRPVSMNPHIMSGRLVVIGTRIPVMTLWGRKHAGAKIEEIAADYGLDSKIVEQALTHIGIRKKAA